MRAELVAYVRRRFSNLRDIELASEDIVDESFALVLARGDGAALSRNFPYLAAVCSHVACGVYRGMKRDSLRAPELESLDELAGSDDPSLPALDAERARAIAESLGALRDIERAIVVQRYYGEASFAEISRATGVNLNTVLSHHRRALMKLKSLLAPYFEEEGREEAEVRGAWRGGYEKYF
jgi:DNA-directed RNA polymerase specialized sigma subunit, sigma24 homolog